MHLTLGRILATEQMHRRPTKSAADPEPIQFGCRQDAALIHQIPFYLSGMRLVILITGA